MLKQRILTIIVLVPFLVWAIYAMPPRVFAISAILVCMWIAWEWSYVCELRSKLLRFCFMILCAAVCFAGLYSSAWIFLLLSILFWMLGLYSVIMVACGKSVSWLNSLILRLAAGIIVIPSLWASVLILRHLWPHASWLLYGLLVVWLSDSAAYVAGRIWGRNKLAQKVSPKKSWEGVCGAVVACILLPIVGHFWFSLSWRNTLLLLVVTLVAGLWSIVGDLFESVLKRRANIKDSGFLLPGHGGILDRTDALLSGLPWFTFGILLLHI